MAENQDSGGGLDEQILELVRKTQETIVDAGRKLAKAGSDAAEQVAPEAACRSDELVDSAFDFTEKILGQRTRVRP